jgi:P4 family phage/plasmid primase-like protien
MSIIPVLADGTKRPQLKWEQYQTERATRDQVKKWFTTSPNSGVGIICGQVSGNIELLELEARANDGESHSLILEKMEELGVADFWSGLLDSGYVASTPSGGLHLVYRIQNHPVPGNTKVARRPATVEELAENPRDRVKVLSETRGEGGYFVAAPTGGTVHKTGESWSLLTGEPGGQIWSLDWNTRCLIHEAITAALDQMPAPVPAPERPVQPVTRTGLAPGEDYADKTTWRSLLEGYGWTYHSMMGSEQMWTRPGKDVREGYSASLYYQGSDNLYVWSSSSELPTEEPISKFAFYTFMEHNGDFSAAASALSRAGYGEKTDFSVDISDWFEETRVGNDLGNGTAAVETVVEAPAQKVRVSEWTETGVGELLGRLYSGKFRSVPEQKLWRVYEKGLWVRDQERKVPGEGVWFALYGDTGCGKSTYLKIINAALGEHARTAAQATFAQRNEGSRAANDLQDIRHARMVMISETKEGQLFNEALIKQYSGGDEMNSHGLYQENGTWENRGVLYMATNHPPRLSADDNANWRRVKLVEFPVSQYNNPEMNPDPKLAEKIIEAELPGVMNWIIQGLRDYREHGLGEPEAVTKAVRAHRTDVDPVAQFLNEGALDGYITVDPEAFRHHSFTRSL